MPSTYETATARRYTWHPLTPDRLGDLEMLFGPNGASGGCRCMSFRLDGTRFRAQCAGEGAANREALRALTNAGNVPGILAYDGDIPVGWCAVGPRDAFPKLDRLPCTGAATTHPATHLSGPSSVSTSAAHTAAVG